VRAAAAAGVKGRGRWRLLFANVDDELSLFVDGRRVTFPEPTTWRRALATAAEVKPVIQGARPGADEPDDLAPVGITALAADVVVRDLRVLRDLYYVSSGTLAAFQGRDPEEAIVTYPLEADQFFMLGDNSSASKDSRAWGTPEAPLHHVDRRLLIGRALVVFWPHAVPTPWNAKVAERCGWELRLPCLPNFARMRFVK
jgi:signal peptidase I